MEGPAVALGRAEPCWLLCLMALTQPQTLPASGVHPLPLVPPHPPQDMLFGSMGTWMGRRPLGGDPGWAQGHCAGATPLSPGISIPPLGTGLNTIHKIPSALK